DDRMPGGVSLAGDGLPGPRTVADRLGPEVDNARAGGRGYQHAVAGRGDGGTGKGDTRPRRCDRLQRPARVVQGLPPEVDGAIADRGDQPEVVIVAVVAGGH